jgi:hypothetical protein
MEKGKLETAHIDKKLFWQKKREKFIADENSELFLFSGQRKICNDLCQAGRIKRFRDTRVDI